MYLEKQNAHNRDKDITFDEGPHIYTVKGDSSFTSVTTWFIAIFHTLTLKKPFKKY